MQDRIDKGQVDVQTVICVEQRHEVLVVTIIDAVLVVVVVVVVVVVFSVVIRFFSPTPGVIHVMK